MIIDKWNKKEMGNNKEFNIFGTKRTKQKKMIHKRNRQTNTQLTAD